MALSSVTRQRFFIKKKRPPGMLKARRDSLASNIESRVYGSLVSTPVRAVVLPASKLKTVALWSAPLLVLVVAVLILGTFDGRNIALVDEIRQTSIWHGQSGINTSSASAGGGRAQSTEESFIATYPSHPQSESKRISTTVSPQNARPTHNTRAKPRHAGRVDCEVNLNSPSISTEQIDSCLQQLDGR